MHLPMKISRQPSEAQKKRMIELFPKYVEKFVQIKNFELPDDIIEKSKQIEVKYSKDIINFITVSRLAPEKAFERTLDAKTLNWILISTKK